MVKFIELVAGNRFLYDSTRECIKIESEVMSVERPCQNADFRMNLSSDGENNRLAGRVVVIFNAIDTNNGDLLSIQSEELVESVGFSANTYEKANTLPPIDEKPPTTMKNEDYTF